MDAGILILVVVLGLVVFAFVSLNKKDKTPPPPIDQTPPTYNTSELPEFNQRVEADKVTSVNSPES